MQLFTLVGKVNFNHPLIKQWVEGREFVLEKKRLSRFRRTGE